MNISPNEMQANQKGRLLWRNLGLTALLIVLLITFVQAGLWQIRRANEKSALRDEFLAAISVTPLNELVARENLQRYQQIELTGRYDNKQQILLENRVYVGRNGYEVLTPLTTAAGTILVNRGWVPASPNRTELPDIAVGAEERQVSGQIDWLPQAGMQLDASESSELGWPRRMLYPTAEQVTQALGYPIVDYQIKLAPMADDGFVRHKPKAPDGPAKNYGYALQWFSFAVLACIFYGIVLRKSIQQHH